MSETFGQVAVLDAAVEIYGDGKSQCTKVKLFNNITFVKKDPADNIKLSFKKANTEESDLGFHPSSS